MVTLTLTAYGRSKSTIAGCISPEDQTKTFKYNAFGRLVRHELADFAENGSFRDYDYDVMNRETERRTFDGVNHVWEVVVIAYDDVGNRDTVMLKRTAPGGLVESALVVEVTDYTYDALNRVTAVFHDYADARADQTIRYTYDLAGNRVMMETPVGFTEYDYDPRGSLCKVMTFPAGTHSYDPADRSCSAAPGASNTTIYTYDPMGMVNKVTLPNGIVSDYDYDALNRLTKLVQKPSGGSAIASYRYKLDNAGNRTHLEETLDGTTRSILWTYDDAYRLTNELRYGGGLNAAWNPTGTQYRSTSYTYDDAGNRLSEMVNSALTTYAYDENDQIETLDTPDGLTTYTYDARGNLVMTVEDPDASSTNITTHYAYDGLDRLVSVSGANTAQYAYNHLGQRIQQTTSSGVTNYLWDELSLYGDVVLETNAANAPIVSYVLSGTQIISQTKASSMSYFLPDGQGSTRLLTDSDGDITANFNYTVFGELRNASDEAFSGTPATNYLYTGQQYDTATEMYSLRARYYDPGVGRFLSRDTWAYDFQNPVELNRYVYAMGNPVNFGDPSGNFAFVDLGIRWIDTQIKQAGGLTKLSATFGYGAAGGAIGYPIGTFAYTLLRATFESTTESLLDGYCRKPRGNSIACKEWRQTSIIEDQMAYFNARMGEIWAFAYDPMEHILAMLVGGITNVASSLFVPVDGTKYLALKGADALTKVNIRGELMTRLFGVGAVASLGQNWAWSKVTGEMLSLAPVVASALVTGLVNAGSLDAPSSGFPSILFNTAAWAFGTVATRYGSAYYDDYLNARQLQEA